MHFTVCGWAESDYILHEAMLPLVFAGFCVVVSGKQGKIILCEVSVHSNNHVWVTVPSVSNVHISHDGVVSWDVLSNTTGHSSLSFRVKVVGERQRTGYYRTVNVSVNSYDLMALNLSPGDYSIQVYVHSLNMQNQ